MGVGVETARRTEELRQSLDITGEEGARLIWQ